MDFVEKLLQDAADRGEFDAGPAAGKPLRVDDTAPGWWGRREAARVAAEDRSNDVIEDVERALGRVWHLPTEQAVRDRVAELNAVLDAAGADARLDGGQVVITWKRMARLRLGRLSR